MAKEKRLSGCFSFILIVPIILSALDILQGLLSLANAGGAKIPITTTLLMGVICILQIICAVLIFKWKRTGIYLYFTFNILEGIYVTFNEISSVKYSHSHIILNIVLSIILYLFIIYLIRPVWKYFN
ncbi:MAG: hypothetical protein Q8936_10555 [Bacillota bacterium]|nr:hypothetical protein [Bacillota bacterium]